MTNSTVIKINIFKDSRDRTLLTFETEVSWTADYLQKLNLAILLAWQNHFYGVENLSIVKPAIYTDTNGVSILTTSEYNDELTRLCQIEPATEYKFEIEETVTIDNKYNVAVLRFIESTKKMKMVVPLGVKEEFGTRWFKMYPSSFNPHNRKQLQEELSLICPTNQISISQNVATNNAVIVFKLPREKRLSAIEVEKDRQYVFELNESNEVLKVYAFGQEE